jgi:glycosyltransferase involved in cell wall biosynthesis
MSDAPLVSAVVPTLDRPQLVERAVESIDAQEYSNVEIIVVDDSTYDGQQPPSFEDIDANLEYIHSENPAGLSSARNRGIREASGKFVAFLDDDDVWEPDKTAKQVKTLQAKRANLCTSWRYMVGSNGAVESVAGTDVEGNVVRKLLCRNVVGPPSGVLVSRHVLDDVGEFDEDFGLWEDREWYLRVAQEYDIVSVHEPLLRYATDTPDKMSGDLRKVREETYDRFLNKHSTLVEEYGRDFVEGWRYRKLGKMGLDAGSRLIPAYWAIRAILLYPFEWPFYRLLLRAAVGECLYRHLDKLKSWI